MLHPTRRALLLGGVTALALARPVFGREWTNFGGDPFAKNDRPAAMKARESIFTDKRYFGLPKDVVEEAMRITELPGDTWIPQPHEHLDVMMSGHWKVLRNWTVGFMENDKTHLATVPYGEQWRIVRPDATYIIILPRVCYNWALRVERAAKEHHHCFAYNVDGRKYWDTRVVAGIAYPPVKNPLLETVVNFYVHGKLEPDDIFRVMNSDCLYAIDGKTGERLFLDRGCKPCEVEGGIQRVWPLDITVETEADLVFTVRDKDGRLGFPSGYGTVYVPAWWAAKVSVLWCFTAANADATTPYSYIGVNDGWRYSDYFDRISLSEVTPEDLAGMEFPRVLKPEGIIALPDFVPGLTRR